MPTIEFMNPGMGVCAVLEAPAGGSLAQLCLERRAPLPIACGSSNCGSCHLRIIAGNEHIEPPGPDELDLLEVLAGPPEARLGCQVQLLAGPGVVRLLSLLNASD